MASVRKGLMGILAAAALVSGCGGGDGAADGLRGARAISAPAVTLRADLAASLDARPWLTVFSVRTTLLDGAASPTAVAARRTLATGSEAVASRLGKAFGSRVGTQALALLRREDALLAGLARAPVLANAPARTAAEVGLKANRRALAELLAAGELSTSALEKLLRPASTSLATALGAVAAGAASAPEQTATAAARAARPAPALARAAKRRRPGLAGDPGSPAAELAAVAAIAFTDATYAQAATGTVVAAGATSGTRLRAATRALDETTDALGQLVASVYGEDAGERFAALWGAHTVAFTDYTRAKVNADLIVAQRALTALDRFRTETARLLDELDPEGPRTKLVAVLDEHVATTTAVIRAQATKSPKVGPRLLEAAAASRAVGRTIAIRFARQFPEKFPAG